MPVSPSDIALLQINRRNFIGNTDKYLPYRSSPATVMDAIRDEFAFLNVVGDAGIYNELYRETAMQRINRYKRFARMYEGKQYENEWEDGERKPIFNFCQVISDKSVDFFAEKGFTVGSDAGNEDLAAAVDYIWHVNEKDSLLRKIGICDSVMGDSFVYLTFESKDEKGNDLPRNQWKMRMFEIDPFFCFPVFDDINLHEMKACMFQIPIAKDGKGAVSYRTLYITPTKWQEVIDGVVGPEQPNPFGCVNVVHFPNYDDPLKIWGQSDLESICSLNEEYNIIANSVRKIIKYHAEPTTIIYGARASKLEKGAKKVWSGLPIGSKVENLAFTADLRATYEYLKLIEDNIHKISGIPSVLFQTDRAVSHTSAIAMKMLYQPILEKTARKQQSFTSSFRRMTKLIFRGFDIVGFDYRGLTGAKEIRTTDLFPVFPDPLPFDESAMVDVDTKKLNMRVTSLAALIRKYNPSGNLDKITAEVIADQISELLQKKEQAVAMQGNTPKPGAILTSSLGMDETIQSLALEISDLSTANALAEEDKQRAMDAEAAALLPGASGPIDSGPPSPGAEGGDNS